MTDAQSPPTSPPSIPTQYPLPAEALLARTQAWMIEPERLSLRKDNQKPLVDLPPENIANQSPFLPHKGFTVNPLPAPTFIVPYSI